MLVSQGVGFATTSIATEKNRILASGASPAESFAALLAAAERQQSEAGTEAVGTTATETSAPNADNLKADFRDWQEKYFQRGISDDRRQQVRDHAASFERLIDLAAEQHAYDNPLAFLQSLSTAELETLQSIHGLVEAIVPTGLSEEGALNLLHFPGNLQDIDQDGFQTVGLARTWQFPPVNAPESVKQAWQEVTADLSEREAMLLEGSFLVLTLPAHLGAQSGGSSYIRPDADYRQIVQQVLEGAEFGRRFDEPAQRATRDRQIELLSALVGKLSADR